jgi:hypothetical protein
LQNAVKRVDFLFAQASAAEQGPNIAFDGCHHIRRGKKTTIIKRGFQPIVEKITLAN